MIYRRLFRQFSASKSQNTIKVGSSWTIERSFSKADVAAFAELSGDKNAVHLDEAVAAKSMFKKPIAHGMLCASLFSNILGNNIPGAIYLKQSLKFTKPVYYDELVKAVLTVTATVADKKRITLETKLVKPDGSLAIEGEAFVWVNNHAITVE